MSGARNCWLDGEDITDAWLRVMSRAELRKYQKIDNDSGRAIQRRNAFMTLFQGIQEGVVVVTAKQTRANGKSIDQIVFLDRRYFRNFVLFEPERQTEFEFDGDRYESIKVKFPQGWVDGQSYDYDLPAPFSATEGAQEEGAQRSQATSGKKAGRPSLKADFIAAFEAIKEDVDLHQDDGKTICRSLHNWFRIRKCKVPNERTMYGYIRKLRNGNLL